MKSSSSGPNALATNNAQHSQRSLPPIPQHLTAEAVAALPPPGLTGPSSICFSASSKHSKGDEKCYLAFLSTTSPSTPASVSRRFHHPRHQATSGGGITIPNQSNSSHSSATSTATATGERQLCAIQLNDLEQQVGTTAPMTQGQIQQYTFPLLKLPLRNSSTPHASAASGIISSSSNPTTAAKPELSLEERLRRERQRLHASGGVTQFSWTMTPKGTLRILVPLRGNIYIQNDVGISPESKNLQLIYDKNANYFASSSASSAAASVETKKSGAVVGRDKSAIDPQLSPDGSMVAFVVAGDIYVVNAERATTTSTTAASEQQQQQQQQHLSHNKPVQITFGASTGSGSSSPSSSPTNVASDQSATISDVPDADKCISHGLADFVAQEEMDRYRGYWWDPQSTGILFTRVDETCVPPYRITHQGRDSGSGAGTTAEEATYEDHRYPFAGKANPQVTLGYVKVDRPSILGDTPHDTSSTTGGDGTSSNICCTVASSASMAEDMSVDGGQQQQQSQERKATNAQPQTQQQQQQRQKGGDDIQMLNYYLDGDDQRMDESTTDATVDEDTLEDTGIVSVDTAHTRACTIARENWLTNVKWLDPPPQAKEYLARINWLPDGTVCAQWQNRLQSTLVLVRIDIAKGTTRPLYVETSDLWINLNHMMRPLPRPIHPDDCDCSSSSSSRGPTTEQHSQQQGYYNKLPNPLPEGSFSFLFASERTGFSHLYVYTYVPGYNEDRAILVRQVSGGDWMVESIAGVDMKKDVVYVTGTHESPLERHLYALPLTNRSRQDSARDSSSTSRNSPLNHDGNDDSRIDSPSPNSGGGGVRRGFKQVISAFGGGSKPRRSNSSMNSNSSVQADDSPTPDPIKLTTEPGMHSIVMDDNCKYFVDTASDLGQPTSVKVYKLPEIFPFPVSPNTAPPSGKLKKVPRNNQDNSDRSIPEQCLPEARRFFSLFDSCRPSSMTSPFVNTYNNDSSSAKDSNWLSKLPAPELLSYPTSDGTETLHAALYRPDPQVFGPGPYPLICAVYGGPHVQRVSRTWAQCADMRAQRLRSFGFAVVKCDNRGSSRRGLAFESSVRNRLGRLEVLDQVTTVRQLVTRGIADPSRVGIYGWSYGGYLAAMCLCRAPDVFHVAVSGAPVTSWDGYDTHYTERYMGLPADNPNGYRESAIFDHVPNMRGKLMLVHGLIDENVHFRHTARLINRLIAAGKDYDLLIFPDERHSPRRLRDRIYMEQRISDYFLRNLCERNTNNVTRKGAGSSSSAGQGGGKGVRPMVGHL